MRRAIPADLDTLLALMGAFYAESNFVLDPAQAASGLAPLLADDSQGWVSIIESGTTPVGFLVLTRGYSMEYGGPTAVLDDIFVQPGARNAGLAGAALEETRDQCRARGLRALSVQVDPGNAPAQAVYRRVGFSLAADRQVLALPLAAPTHVV